MEELELQELFKYYLRKIPIILIITAITTIIGYIYTDFIQIPMYKGITTIILVEKNDTKKTEESIKDTITINEKLVTTYSEVIKSRRVLTQVKEELKLKKTIKELANQINVSSIEETSIIKITVTDNNNKLAAEIANKTAEIFKQEITEIYPLENVSIIDEAIIEKNPYNVEEIKQIIISTLIGLILSCLLIFIIYYFDTTIKNKKEIEEKLNIAVIGEVPSANYLYKLEKKEQLKLLRSEKKKSTQSQKQDKLQSNKTLINNEDLKPKTKKNPTTTKTSKNNSTQRSTTTKTNIPKTKIKGGKK